MKTIDLFAGCGGMSLGFANVGFQIQAAFDHWQPAVRVYQENFEHPMHSVDLAESAAHELIQQYDAEMIIGGPPCQDFSSAGKRDEGLGRADLTLTFADIVADNQPQWFVMENVERIQKSHVLQQAKQTFKAAGYGLTETVLLASLCGVPQNRKRYFLVGELHGEDDMLLPYLEKNLAEKPMTVHDYLGDTLGLTVYYRHPRTYQRRGIFSIHEPSPTVRGVNRPVPKTYQQHHGDAGAVTPALRALTTYERSLIQTFPEDFIWQGTKTNLEQMIGNAVPVKLAEYIARAILDYQTDRDSGTLQYTTPLQLSLFDEK